jgi:folate-binding Fe-S cluster repair protein YgfZ
MAVDNLPLWILAWASSDHDVAPPEKYTLHRVLNGVPEGIVDMPPEDAFPMEANMDLMGGGGCFQPEMFQVQVA